MKHILYGVLLSLFCLWHGTSAFAQNEDPFCNDVTIGDVSFVNGGAIINNGSAVNLKKNGIGGQYKSNVIAGQVLVGETGSLDYSNYFGFWGGLIAPPKPPTVRATQGELKDRIQISWTLDPLSSGAAGGFKLFRDGVFMATLDESTTNFNDFNIIAGRPYVYTVLGVNAFGEGSAGSAIGFLIPNGVVTGWVQTINGSPVPDALVSLTPMQGFSLALDTTAGAFAFADTNSMGTATFLPSPGEDWSMAFWIKTEFAKAGAAIMGLEPFPLFIQALPSSSGDEGVGIALTATGTPFLSGVFPEVTDVPVPISKNDWHHVALTYNGSGGQARLYIDGALIDLAEMVTPLPQAESLKIGNRTNTTGWRGKLDELRIYHRCLNELDLGEIQMSTASTTTPNLAYYWKLDEELGTKSFDVINQTKLYFCGADFDEDRPPVHTAGKTNEDGYYRIEAVSYGTGVTFLAEPSKDFYMHRSVQFTRSEMDYATLPDFSLTKKATLELWVNNTRPAGTQSLLSKQWTGNDFRLQLVQNGVNNDIVWYHNGTTKNFGTLGMNYQHLAFTIDSASGAVNAYKNGVSIGSTTINGSTAGIWSDGDGTREWVLGARESSGYTDYFDGVIDEFAVYDSTLAVSTILEHAQNSRDPQEKGLRVYFAMDEGSGNRLNNAGSALLEPGMTFGTMWTPLSPNQETEPHIFAPSTRQVTLNPSDVSVDQVDFVDRSTVAVSGFVRYKNTDCFAVNVEILVNGESYSPKIFTDSTGKYVIDFDPGTTAELTPVYNGHEFEPQSRFVINVVNPIAGLLFNDITTRKISGQIAGGSQDDCRKSIISGPTEDCRVTVRTQDGCYERVQLITATDGIYEFDNLPPLEVTIAVTKHNNPAIYGDFQTQGGRTIDLTLEDSMNVNFIYVAPPKVAVTGFDAYTTMCLDDNNNPIVVLEQRQVLPLDITVYEQYGPQGLNAVADRCLLDTAEIVIDNTFDLLYDFIEPKVDSMFDGKYEYVFTVENPNPNPPYLQIMQVTADVGGKKGTFIQKALITGMIPGAEKFTTQLPMMPNFVLRDPPGDGSYAYIEKGETVCNTLEITEAGGGGFYFESEIKAGPSIEGTIPFIGTKYQFDFLAGSAEELDIRVIGSGKQSMQYCVTTNERISTDDGDLVVGGSTSFDAGNTILAGNDVYVGTGFNLIFSDSRKLTYNDTICQPKLESIVTAQPDTFATTYIYSEWNIENNVIRYLDSLIQSGNDLDSINTKSKQRWLDYIQLNKELKADAIYKRNLSWDAGVEYEYSETRDTTLQWEKGIEEKFEGLLAAWFETDADALGVEYGGEFKIGAKAEGNFTQMWLDDTIKTWNIGYVLKDDDPGDNWTMDVKDDPMYKTPVFDIIAGQTSCPWEVGTAQREGVKLISVDGNTRLDVPSNGKASFNFLLNNNSQTGETYTYSLTAGPESNTNGAIIKLNGAPLDHNVYYAIPWGEGPIPVTITVERGPEEYFYTGMEIVLFSECHDIRCNDLGFLPDLDEILYSAVYLTVGFVEPCSEVDIAFPLEGWVVKPDDVNPLTQDILPITVADYDLNDDDLQGVRLQYRPKDGDGAWINITSGVPDYIPKADLGAIFTQYSWDTGGNPKLADGEYEIRAVTICTGGPDDYPGISHIISGKIDRQPPSLIGVPEPSDGVYNVGDEISFTFNKKVNCNKLNAVDNVLLFDATTDNPIDIDITCYENKIILDPNFQNEFFENRILRAELHDIEDYTGNNLIYEKWEFYVDRNELAWLTDSVGMTKFEDETKTVLASIHNRGGYPVPFTITDLPNWVHVVPNQGTLAANEIREIRFEVDSSLAFGLWSDSITLHTETGQNPFFMGGDERLPMGVRVVCRPPNWDLDAAGLYINTMNMVLEVDIQGVLSNDEEDIVAAYIDDELRGRAHVEYAPQVDKYLAYLTIYGDTNDVAKPVRLEVWDASGCLRYGQVQQPDTIPFQPDVVVGFPSTPEVIYTNSLVLREIPLGYGWNWISFNLDFPNDSLNYALASLKHPDNDFVRTQNPFSVYSGTNWVGTLNTFGDSTMYVYKTDQPDTIKMLGNLINPVTRNIPVGAGWQWIGYIPNYALPINNALSSLPAAPGDVVKSQFGFAQYLNNTYGWVGNLKYMQPPRGYQINLASAGTLTYPADPFVGGQTESRGEKDTPISSYWTVDPAQFEFGMTLIGALEANGENITTSTMELGAFAGNEVRGAAAAIYIASRDAYEFFLTSYANTNGELLSFKLYDSETGEVQDLTEKMYFSADQHQGTIEDPVPFSLLSTSTNGLDIVQTFDIQPNPFNTETTFRFSLSEGQDINLIITDVRGREVSSIRTQAVQGLNVLRWNGMSNAGVQLNPGVYFVQLKTGMGSVSKKVVIQR